MTAHETPTTGRAKSGVLDDPRDLEPRADGGASTPSLSDPRRLPDEETEGDHSQPGGEAFQIIDFGERSRESSVRGRERQEHQRPRRKKKG